MLVAKNHQKFRSRCLVREFSFTDVFNDINHSYRVATLKKNSFWLLPFSMVVAAYCYYEKLRKTMCTAIVSYLLKYHVHKVELKLHEFSLTATIQSKLTLKAKYPILDYLIYWRCS